MQFMVREPMAGARKPCRATGLTVRWASLGLALACGFSAVAQEPDAAAQPAEATAAEVLSQLSDLVQAVESPQPEDTAPAIDPASTNDVSQASAPAPGGDRPNRFIHPDAASRPDSGNHSPGPSRSQSNDRRSRGRRSSGSNSSQSGGYGSAGSYSPGDRTQTNTVTGTNSGPVVLDYAAFKLIVDRNIFDPNRFPHRPGEVRVVSKPRSVDSLTLVGTMSYEKGTFAFFDGTSSDYKKSLKLTDSIAGYKIAGISPNAVKLAAGTNELELSVGAQLRREEDGPWRLAGQSVPYVANPASTSTNATAASTATGTDAAAAGSESDIIKRLMQKREKE